MEAVLNAGDEVIILDPSWVSYEPCVQMAGGKPVHHPLDTRTFQVDESLVERITQNTRMVVVNSPSNPSGSVLDRSSLGLLADICEDYDLVALSDEIYEKLFYGKEHISLASIGDMAQTNNHGEWVFQSIRNDRVAARVGCRPQAIINQMSKVQQHSISHPTTFAMYGGVAALTCDQSCVETMRTEFKRRRDYLVQELLLTGYEVAPADGAFYAYIKTGGDDIATARKWLEKALVAVTPGSAFNTPGWQRISYATSMERLHSAVLRIRRIT